MVSEYVAERPIDDTNIKQFAKVAMTAHFAVLEGDD